MLWPIILCATFFFDVHISSCPVTKAMISLSWCCPASQCNPLVKRMERTQGLGFIFVRGSHALSYFIPLLRLSACRSHTLSHAVRGLRASQTIVFIMQWSFKGLFYALKDQIRCMIVWSPRWELTTGRKCSIKTKHPQRSIQSLLSLYDRS